MAYINVSLPIGEGRIFELPPYGRKDSFTELTIDKEKDAVLFKDMVDRDNPENEHFYFYYKGKMISMTLNGKEYINYNTKIWKLKSIFIPKELSKDKVLSELREALKVYGCRGMSEERQELWRRKFKRENPNGFAVTDF